MKKYLSILIFISLYSCHTFAQEVIVELAKKYYRSNPFEGSFNQFLNHLMNDPTLKEKTIHKKTDSTLFFLEGAYSTHNPFFLKANKTKIILAEREEVETGDSLQYFQTTFLYQLIAYASPSEAGTKDVKEAFEKICRHYKKKFDGEYYREIKYKGIQTGEVRDYSLNYPGFLPLTVAWATTNEEKDNLIALTIRFRVFDNLAYIPTALEGFQ